MGLDEYVERMQEGQSTILYILCYDAQKLCASWSTEVLMLTLPMEVAVLRLLGDYEGRTFEAAVELNEWQEDGVDRVSWLWYEHAWVY